MIGKIDVFKGGGGLPSTLENFEIFALENDRKRHHPTITIHEDLPQPLDRPERATTALGHPYRP